MGNQTFHWRANAHLGINPNFVALTNTKTRTVFVPFGFLIVLATLRVARRFLALTNKQVNLLAVRVRHGGPRGTRTPDIHGVNVTL